jgi:hypothetical protein
MLSLTSPVGAPFTTKDLDKRSRKLVRISLAYRTVLHAGDQITNAASRCRDDRKVARQRLLDGVRRALTHRGVQETIGRRIVKRHPGRIYAAGYSQIDRR